MPFALALKNAGLALQATYICVALDCVVVCGLGMARPKHEHGIQTASLTQSINGTSVELARTVYIHCMIVYLVISLPTVPCIHVYTVGYMRGLKNPNY